VSLTRSSAGGISNLVSPLRIAIDSNAVDHMLDNPELLETIRMAAQRLNFIFIGNHVILDQLTATPNEDRRIKLLAIYNSLPKEDVLTRGAYYGISRYGQAKYADDSNTGMSLSQVKTSGKGGAHDALIAMTASGEADVLITDDSKLAKKMRRNGAACVILTFQSLFVFYESRTALVNNWIPAVESTERRMRT